MLEKLNANARGPCTKAIFVLLGNGRIHCDASALLGGITAGLSQATRQPLDVAFGPNATPDAPMCVVAAAIARPMVCSTAFRRAARLSTAVGSVGAIVARDGAHERRPGRVAMYKFATA